MECKLKKLGHTNPGPASREPSYSLEFLQAQSPSDGATSAEGRLPDSGILPTALAHSQSRLVFSRTVTKMLSTFVISFAQRHLSFSLSLNTFLMQLHLSWQGFSDKDIVALSGAHTVGSGAELGHFIGHLRSSRAQTTDIA